MTFAIALLCAVTLSPAECSRENAVDVIPLGESQNELTCIMDAQATLAQLAIRSDASHYFKIACTRTAIGKEAGNWGGASASAAQW